MNNNHLIAKFYRGFVIAQQPDGNWIIQNFPTWTPQLGGVAPGPYSWTVATHQIDRFLKFAK